MALHAEIELPCLSKQAKSSLTPLTLFVCLFICLFVYSYLLVYMTHCLTFLFHSLPAGIHQVYKRSCFLDLHPLSMVSLLSTVGGLVNLFAHTIVAASLTVEETSS